MKRLSLVLAVFLLSVLSACQQDTLQTERPRPNIIYIMSDDHALRTIGAYADFHRTPNMDRLANGGATFTNAFVGNSICGPSRASILTGMHSHKNGVTGNGSPWDSTQMVFPRLLQALQP